MPEELSEICGICGAEVIAFARKPIMWEIRLASSPVAGEASHVMISDRCCIECATEFVKLRATLSHKHDEIKAAEVLLD